MSKVNFDHAWSYLEQRSPLKIKNLKDPGLSTTVVIKRDAIRFQSPTDRKKLEQGGRSQSKDTFRYYFGVWFDDGKRERKDFRNRRGKGSKTPTFKHLKPLFTHLSSLPELYSTEEGDTASQVANDIDEPPGRVKSEIYRIIRDTAVTRKLKALYKYKCQICDFTFKIEKNKSYCEAHHIRPLGGKHKGTDSEGNIIIVCPNHHAMLDYGAIKIDLSSIKIIKTHSIDPKNVEYHNNKI